MRAPNRNTLWAGVFVDELARAGLRAVCIAPGSRSTPLTLAFAEQEQIAVYSHIDERSAGFFAVGMALAGDAPVALVCTSGTAAANFHPAIIEACQSHVPLLVLTADRPHDQRDSGANQTIDQVKMYGDHVRWFVDVAPPQAGLTPRTLRYLRTLACRALAAANGAVPGPVHLNFPFRKPLEPTPAPGDVAEVSRDASLGMDGRPHGTPFAHVTRGDLSPTDDQVDLLVQAITGVSRGMIVCGPRRHGQGDAFPQTVARLAQLAGYPIFADALSGVRFGPHVEQAGPLIVAGYETFLQSDVAVTWEPPALVLRFGAMPTSKALQLYLDSLAACRQITVDGSGAWRDADFRVGDYVWAEPAATCRRVLDRLEAADMPVADEAWVAAIQRAEQQCWQATEATFQEGFFGGVVLADVAGLLPDDAVLYVSNSLPVRHLDQFARPRRQRLRVLANRGASGIDGIVSSGLGAAAATEDPLVLVTGDLAFYHDLNGLLALRRCGAKATIVVINNDGGGIFRRLPVAAFDPPFTELFVTPHGLDFEPAVRMYGAEFVRVETREAFRRALRRSVD
ncbi:MAG: 2-succinyl-5-enolpyruvyl-6-hydroxy-3-cyclohexene-1-carboxylic-acid synthase, partial [Anaerolineae bacterium]